MAYSIENITEDCYEGTSCLINKLGIRDEEKLKEFEAAVTFAKAGEYELQPLFDTFEIAQGTVPCVDALVIKTA